MTRWGKTRAVLEHAIVQSDANLAAGSAVRVLVVVGRGRAADVRAALDEMGGAGRNGRPSRGGPRAEGHVVNGGPLGPFGGPRPIRVKRPVDGMTLARLALLREIETRHRSRSRAVRLHGPHLRSARWLHDHGHVNADADRRKFWARAIRPPTHEHVP